jgi:hypothetical protein
VPNGNGNHFYTPWICVKMALAAYKKLKRGNLLPWLLLSYALLIIPQGQWHNQLPLVSLL